MKKKVLAMTAMVLVLSSSMTTFAAPKEVEVNGEKFTFDAEYYAQNNPDVVAALGSSEEAVLQHYVQYGRAEGRAAYDGDTGAKATSTTTTTATKSTESQPKYMEFVVKSGNVTEHIDYVYDANGNKTSESSYRLTSGGTGGLDYTCTTTYSYNENGDVSKETVTGPNGESWHNYSYSYKYDDQGRISVCYADGEVRSYVYDSNGRLSKISSVYNGLPYGECTYTYDKNGRVIKKTGDLETGYDYTYTYDKQGRLATWKNSLGTAKFYY